MKAKVKMSVIISVMCLVALTSIIAIVAIFAANSQTFNSSISVSYKSEEVSGTATAKYYVGSADSQGTEMRVGGEAEGATSIEFNAGDENKNTTLSPVNKDIKLSSTNNFILFEYYFTNSGPQNDYKATLTVSQANVKNMLVYTAESPSKLEHSAVTDKVDNAADFTVSSIIYHNSNGYVYVKAEIEDKSKDSNFTIQFNWDLKKYAIEIDPEADAQTEQTFSLEQSGNGYKITGLQAEADTTNITVPESYKGKLITTVGANAFSTGNLTNSTITIAGNVKTIEDGAFAGQKSIKKVVIGDSVTTVGNIFDEEAYSGTYIGTLVIGKNVKSIPMFNHSHSGVDNGVKNYVIRSKYAFEQKIWNSEDNFGYFNMYVLKSAVTKEELDEVINGDSHWTLSNENETFDGDSYYYCEYYDNQVV